MRRTFILATLLLNTIPALAVDPFEIALPVGTEITLQKSLQFEVGQREIELNYDGRNVGRQLIDLLGENNLYSVTNSLPGCVFVDVGSNKEQLKQARIIDNYRHFKIRKVELSESPYYHQAELAIYFLNEITRGGPGPEFRTI